jgi:uncharacterized protein YgbK (DUF1537 family)
MKLMLGVIADDVTGATDIASTIVNQGLRVTQVLGVPDELFDPGEAQAIVVALKSRSNAATEAVAWSLQALHWLRAQGAEQIVFKYCSTFDSTADGNIGPVTDALMDELGARFAFVCPAFPDNRRTVYQGHLFVGDALLSESSMKDHPLTPMRDASLLRLLRAQSAKRVGLIPHDIVSQGGQPIKRAVNELIEQGVSYGVVDVLSNADLFAIGHAAAKHSLVTGGSAIAAGLVRNFKQVVPHTQDATARCAPRGRALVIAGSCAEATRRQIAAVQDTWPHRKIDLDALQRDPSGIDTVVSWAIEQNQQLPVLIYASSTPQEVTAMQDRYGIENAGAMVEAALSAVAHRLVGAGFRRLVVAGGETSAAVLSALDIEALRIGAQIDPGVPWTSTFTDARTQVRKLWWG